MILGVDTGGTFTDFVLVDEGRLRVHKVLSTPGAPENAILKGVAELGLEVEALRVVHGSTVATNAALEGKGVRTAYVTNKGLGDLLSIGRQARPGLYDLQPRPSAPPVARSLCLEVAGRLSASGQIIEPMTEDELSRLAEVIRSLDPRSVAVNLLYSYIDDSIERAIAEIVPEGVFVSLSSRVLPEIREYERGVATWLNAWIGPLVEGYVRRLCGGLPQARIAVMQSSGETMAAEQAASQAVRMLLSGPAGGLIGARFVGRLAGRERLLSFDMGGTSTDVALIDGEPRLTSEGNIGPYPVAVPMVDMHTIGAGGGSIARIDAGGMLQVGPESAGAEPGPACYGRGGEVATVTDANLVLGRLRPEAFLGGAMKLDVSAARGVMSVIGGRMGCGVEEAAEGVIRVANEHMARALRVISVQRGVDPRAFTLVSFGGAGGLHVCALADALGMNRAMVPIHAGVLSALGMLTSAPGRQLSQTLQGPLKGFSDEQILSRLEGLERRGREALVAEGVSECDISTEFSVDARYFGQSYTLNVPWLGISRTETEFHQAHNERYGHRMDLALELVNLRAAVRGPRVHVSSQPLARGSARGPKPRYWSRLYRVGDRIPVFDRAELLAGDRVRGPALVTEAVATTWLAPGWLASVDRAGNLILEAEPS